MRIEELEKDDAPRPPQKLTSSRTAATVSASASSASSSSSTIDNRRLSLSALPQDKLLQDNPTRGAEPVDRRGAATQVETQSGSDESPTCKNDDAATQGKTSPQKQEERPSAGQAVVIDRRASMILLKEQKGGGSGDSLFSTSSSSNARHSAGRPPLSTTSPKESSGGEPAVVVDRRAPFVLLKAAKGNSTGGGQNVSLSADELGRQVSISNIQGHVVNRRSSLTLLKSGGSGSINNDSGDISLFSTNMRKGLSMTMDLENLRPELLAKIKVWLISFYHCDPRYKILKFFNQVAAEGADKLITTEEPGNNNNDRKNNNTSTTTPATTTTASSAESSSSSLEEEEESERAVQWMKDRFGAIFDATSVLTVWRPCSLEAIRKMMQGMGVGKGLDIKGKSAKQGLLSAFVPFLQIHENAHKSKIQPLSAKAKMRIYFYSFQARQTVMDAIQKYVATTTTIREEEEVEHAENNNGFSDSNDDAVDPNKMVQDPCTILDTYAPTKGLFGFEVAQRLFWEACIVPQDVTRNEETATGRASLAGFQDANMKTLKVACQRLDELRSRGVQQEDHEEDETEHSVTGHSTSSELPPRPERIKGRPPLAGYSDSPSKNSSSHSHRFDESERSSSAAVPVPVVMQYDKENPMRPQTLVMAYEENGTVTPVVSDFDGFLLGWRREQLRAGITLPAEQQDLMMWSLQHIEEILDHHTSIMDNSERSDHPPSTSWTVQWLQILKEESNNGFVPEIPQYGFGDPKSYGIMEKAATKLIDTGAVRHGSECFNYYFPQEIDDYFLLISDTLRPVPWKYVNVAELQTILIQKIKEGFVFPLNPKWILCDPGWKEVYDELMASQALYADQCKEVWFPKHNGIRDKINELSQKYPRGFYQPPQPKDENEGKIIFDTSARETAYDLAALELEEFNQQHAHKKKKLSKVMKKAGKTTKRFGQKIAKAFRTTSSVEKPRSLSPKDKSNNSASKLLSPSKLIRKQLKNSTSSGSLSSLEGSPTKSSSWRHRKRHDLDTSSKHEAGRNLMIASPLNLRNLRPELKGKIKTWLSSFYQCDPRYKILTFFNQVAAEGADRLIEEDDDCDIMASEEFRKYSTRNSQTEELSSMRPSVLTKTIKCRFGSIFNATSILTVWRPCSKDAIQKMMQGTGVGKGLDIKGKSAKRGMLSGFVPFLQIHDNHDKAKMHDLYESARMKIYYQSLQSRQTAIDIMMPHVNIADKTEYKIPGRLELLDTFSDKGLYGVEAPQRLFWRAFVAHQDITRDADTATGRPSMAGFQDANMKTLKDACSLYPAPSPMPAVLQYDKDNPIRPQTLIMAYEENGTVTPVVSDFDGFLLGWRREALRFGDNLPAEQEDLMMWCMDHIEDVLEEQSTTTSWTVQWLEILKEESTNGFVPEIPEYGFGDPKSYGIMEKAAKRLSSTGAVRHGSECFNYYFPQEIDDYFLLVSDTFSPVPWKYVNVSELQDILIEKVREGFMFPLNPKWILCDPGWKRVYDELISSQALYAEGCNDVWFPRENGIRAKIEEIHERFPRGLLQDRRDPSMSGKMAYELAAVELEEFNKNSKKLSLSKVIKKAGKRTRKLGKKTLKVSKKTAAAVVGGTAAASKKTAKLSKKTAVAVGKGTTKAANSVLGGTAAAGKKAGHLSIKTAGKVVGGTAKMLTTVATTPGKLLHHHPRQQQRFLGEDAFLLTELDLSNQHTTELIAAPLSLHKLRPELVVRVQNWLSSFYRCDPRYKILTFFNQVAAEGADRLIKKEDPDDDCTYDLDRDGEDLGLLAATDLSKAIKVRFGSIFDVTSILTVWRPCSNDAIRKMMEGTGVGKGLDIKGKSAKKGLLSAFVPLMQIHDNDDKAKIQELCESARMRIYFHSEAARETAIETMMPLVNIAEQAAIETVMPHVNMAGEVEYTVPHYLELLDSFSDKDLYGIEVSQRLFWDSCIVNQDISRDEEIATGRPSLSGFQDANMKTLKVACSKDPSPAPMPVVLQYDKDNPLRPQTFLMAYEENGTVTPVVSDFDGFLLGWRREALPFGNNLPVEQEDLMMWCLDHIEDLLEEEFTSESWTVQWLEILKEESMNGFVPEIPEYGFGDPKSYGIMEKAAKRLSGTGAVRHGSECFNYYFPQEIDDHFLLVSDTLSPVPWKYVSVTELQDVLIEKIREGFAFPLNPKWVLCDPGWKRVYDELMGSRALYAEECKDVWFPLRCGIRDKIEEIHERFPGGFLQDRKDPKRDSKLAYDLAALELEEFTRNSKKSALSKVMRKATRKTKKISKKTLKVSKKTAAAVVGGTTAAVGMTLDISQRTAATVFESTTAASKMAGDLGIKTATTVLDGTATVGKLTAATLLGGTAAAGKMITTVAATPTRLMSNQGAKMLGGDVSSELDASRRRETLIVSPLNLYKLRPGLRAAIKKWLASFYRCDPRYKILTFFNQVAAEGADKLIQDERFDQGEDVVYDLDLDSKELALLSAPDLSKAIKMRFGSIFDATSILTVWRPCSNDAIRKMMEGKGVGKGLDIKGKSAKKGLLSAFVPFMQIHENDDKAKIQELYESARMRIYFHSEEARLEAIETMMPYVNMEEDTQYKIPGDMELLDDFSGQGVHGVEVSQRLFWEGCIVPQDISRDAETETGRPSIPGFQDANMKTLKVACSRDPPPSPMPVVMQYDQANAVRPQTLVLAYEENGTVTPVVSDFDGFLLGWRREALRHGNGLPEEQEDLMMWCLDHIEDLLEEELTSETWTMQWLEILKEESTNGFVPEIPEYGFGDPKSYGIMEKAARRLIDSGAVRHGSECFNYYFPQEIDDYFLLVSDTLSPVPWKYVDVTELQDILIEKIKEGFVFPLNPKWVLCDPGWKRVYDALMESRALYAEECKDVWFPLDCGVRDKIEEIHAKFPNGFQQDRQDPKRDSKLAWDLAALELEEFNKHSQKSSLSKVINKARKKTKKIGKKTLKVSKKTAVATAKMSKKTAVAVVGGTTAAVGMTLDLSQKTAVAVVDSTSAVVGKTAEMAKETAATVVSSTTAAATAVVDNTTAVVEKTAQMSIKTATAVVGGTTAVVGKTADLGKKTVVSVMDNTAAAGKKTASLSKKTAATVINRTSAAGKKTAQLGRETAATVAEGTDAVGRKSVSMRRLVVKSSKKKLKSAYVAMKTSMMFGGFRRKKRSASTSALTTTGEKED